MSRKKRKRSGQRRVEGRSSGEGGSAEEESPPEPNAPHTPKDPTSKDKKRGGKDTPEGPRTRYTVWRENLEALAVAFILALVIRHFAVEAFEIPTGSMATTLYGIHAESKCPNCDKTFEISLPANPTRPTYHEMWVYEGKGKAGPDDMLHVTTHLGNALCSASGEQFRVPGDKTRKVNARREEVRCPRCAFRYIAILDEKNRTGGDKIFVTKFAYTLIDPRRWDVVVFGFDEWKNYIKRLVGLPGERIDLFDGDLYVNGQIERKSNHPYVQDELWTEISDSKYDGRQITGHPRAWREVAARGSGRDVVTSKYVSWNTKTQRWNVNAGAGGEAIMEFQRSFDDYNHYNALRAPSTRIVGDKKIAFTIKAAKPEGASSTNPTASGPWLGIEIRERDHTFQLRLPFGAVSAGTPAILERIDNEDFGAQEASLTRPPHTDGPAAQSGVFSIPFEEAVRVELEIVDDQVVARMGEPDSELQTLFSMTYSSLDAIRKTHPEFRLEDHGSYRLPSDDPRAHGIRIAVSNALVELSAVRVYRDIYYIAPADNRLGGGGHHWPGIELGDDEYFVLGDNSQSSSDGRYWKAVPRKNFMGKAFVVIWPLGRMQRIR